MTLKINMCVNCKNILKNYLQQALIVKRYKNLSMKETVKFVQNDKNAM